MQPDLCILRVCVVHHQFKKLVFFFRKNYHIVRTILFEKQRKEGRKKNERKRKEEKKGKKENAIEN